MTMYMVLALGAFMLKVYGWHESRKYQWADFKWFILIGAFAVQNASEFFAYDLFAKNISADTFFKVYYSITLGLLSSIYLFVKDDASELQRRVFHVMLVTGVAVSLAIFFTPYLINGHVPGAYPIQAQKGDFFAIYLLYGISCLVGIVVTIIHNYLSSKDPESRLVQLYIVKAFSPFLLVAAYVALGMLFSFPVNASGLFPIATTLFILITIHSRCTSTYEIEKDPRSSIPFSSEAGLLNEIVRTTTQYSLQNICLKDGMRELEGAMIRYSVAQHEGSKSKLARRLNVSRATLDRLLDRYEIEWDRT
ncbi:MAG: helix-turn-helix domain-containing protein [Pseudomonadota bacterium]